MSTKGLTIGFFIADAALIALCAFFYLQMDRTWLAQKLGIRWVSLFYCAFRKFLFRKVFFFETGKLPAD